MSHEVSCDTHCGLSQATTMEKGNLGTLGTAQVVWEINEWDSPSDDSRPGPANPGELPRPQAASQTEGPPSAARQAVLLPWDMM